MILTLEVGHKRGGVVSVGVSWGVGRTIRLCRTCFFMEDQGRANTSERGFSAQRFDKSTKAHSLPRGQHLTLSHSPHSARDLGIMVCLGLAPTLAPTPPLSD